MIRPMVLKKLGSGYPQGSLTKFQTGRPELKSLQMEPNGPEGPFGYICTLRSYGGSLFENHRIRRKQRAAGVIVVTM